MTNDPRIDGERLSRRLAELARHGALPGGGVCRLALTDEDKAGRDQVVRWMRELGLTVTVDGIGNAVGIRKGQEDGPPVMVGSHIDTVRTGGPYDGNLGVMAGLEVVAALNDAKVVTRRPLAVAFFTNEEGSRFQPDMMGSLVYAGALPLERALATVGIDGTTVRENLARIGYAGDGPLGGPGKVHAYVELHVEQGPVLEEEGFTIGAVEGVQGISWTELTLTGQSNHAGTTPMRLRHDAGYVAAEIAVFARRLARELGGHQVATVGALTLFPNLVNVVANRVVMTVDLRNTDEARLQEAERRLFAFVEETAAAEGVKVARRSLARFKPVAFAPALVARVEAIAKELRLSVKRLPSGAGHDAQILAAVCPACMIFVPSVKGVSHNVEEFTKPADLAAGAEVLLRLVLELAR
ncbi:Zn-dependent hydrolase [Anaeromyxobacter diazotrophicus]|uniref:Zn-dependent hydrolase n=1 Tax=Anaeromyxobacter diazotrophicus TaxID=2590199 RepID=A0A7I9VR53_9BACT|nr:Zn-dependent hydrolase [Anaeromyxobacter diazotrophicus]GEJ58906.1 Zn-dependent hydrolase [Anaeromyxobacter diazotrophicus]